MGPASQNPDPKLTFGVENVPVSGAEREAAMLEAQKLDLRRDVALAWLERHYASRNRALVEAQMREADLLIQSSQADVASGRTAGAEAIAALSAKATLGDKLEDMKRMERRTTAMLARWPGCERRARAVHRAPRKMDLHGAMRA